MWGFQVSLESRVSPRYFALLVMGISLNTLHAITIFLITEINVEDSKWGMGMNAGTFEHNYHKYGADIFEITIDHTQLTLEDLEKYGRLYARLFFTYLSHI